MKNISLPRNERKRFYDSIVDTNTTYNYYVERLTDIAVSRFKWTGFPDSIDTRFLELTLFEKGQAVVFEDDVMGLLSLNTAISGSWNVYNVPIKRRAYATNGYNKNLTIENSVIVFNNYIRTPSVQHILNFSKKRGRYPWVRPAFRKNFLFYLTPVAFIRSALRGLGRRPAVGPNPVLRIRFCRLPSALSPVCRWLSLPVRPSPCRS
mgnify:CR=1 FL=1